MTPTQNHGSELLRCDGLPPGLFSFFADLEEQNTREFWQLNRRRWEVEVRDPFRALLHQLAQDFPSMRMFRPHRDVRFARDKAPYRTSAGAVSPSDTMGGPVYYLEASASGLAAGYGAMAMSPDELRRFRAAIDSDDAAREFEKVLISLDAQSVPVTSGAHPPLRTAPRGYPIDHPRIELLRWKGVAAVREWPRAAWMSTPGAAERIRSTYRAADPLRRWIEQHVAD